MLWAEVSNLEKGLSIHIGFHQTVVIRTGLTASGNLVWLVYTVIPRFSIDSTSILFSIPTLIPSKTVSKGLLSATTEPAENAIIIAKTTKVTMFFIVFSFHFSNFKDALNMYHILKKIAIGIKFPYLLLKQKIGK